MSFELRASEGDAWELVLMDEPGYVHALPMAPEKIESELGVGTWLVVAFPVWSGPVRESVRAAIASAKQYGGKFELGIRPFEAYDEFGPWWPDRELPGVNGLRIAVENEGPRRAIHISSDPGSDPKWLVLREGEMLYQGAGPRSRQQLSEVMRKVLV